MQTRTITLDLRNEVCYGSNPHTIHVEWYGDEGTCLECGETVLVREAKNTGGAK